MSTKRRRRVSRKPRLDPLQRAIFVIGNPRGYIVGQNPSGAGAKFDSEDHVRECWREVREEIISDCWIEPHPRPQESWLDRRGMSTAFWIYDAPDIDEKRRDGENDRELLARFGITDAQGAIDYPTRRQEAGSARDGLS